MAAGQPVEATKAEQRRQARTAGKNANRQRAAEHGQLWIEWGRVELARAPGATIEDAAFAVWKRCRQEGIRFRSGKSYALRTILDHLRQHQALLAFDGQDLAHVWNKRRG